jgi:hypothetical protein
VEIDRKIVPAVSDSCQPLSAQSLWRLRHNTAKMQENRNQGDLLGDAQNHLE